MKTPESQSTPEKPFPKVGETWVDSTGQYQTIICLTKPGSHRVVSHDDNGTLWVWDDSLISYLGHFLVNKKSVLPPVMKTPVSFLWEAIDKDGQVYHYTKHPKCGSGQWLNQSDGIHINVGKHPLPLAFDWKQSLRPINRD